MTITDAQWQSYLDAGYLRLGRLLNDAALAALQKRIDQIMLGTATIDYARLLMQLDSDTGKYEDAGPQTMGHKGPTLNYRKIQELELDDLFLAYTRRPIFRDICARTYGPGTAVASYRAMFMNKPAGKGTLLPWHQDRWTELDRDPLITVWTALDAATIANGCVQVIPASHKLGLVNPEHPSAFLSAEQAARLVSPANVLHLELTAGEAVLLHNWLIHASDVNRTDHPRRAFSVCYMDARTRTQSGRSFPVIFDPAGNEPLSHLAH